ncbi:MAG: hypothetical protein RMX96_31810 [Nostoc sp. ChiSLP02]|nr:hypothetical protein [Nostoc sp. DedSLP05]MDZ8103357.1 hypothetical protein [Nostoc sp. DedSLP01]MDZ8189410.1 hypothetical protein [Nostoc sp. ChiSLP02]
MPIHSIRLPKTKVIPIGLLAVLFIFFFQYNKYLQAGRYSYFSLTKGISTMNNIQSQAGSISQREIRHFAVYKQTRLVLLAEDKPGVLISSASPAPGGPLQHPFLNAQAMDSRYENEMGSLLRQSSSFDGFINLLIQHDYDIRSFDYLDLPKTLTKGYRIFEKEKLLAVIWNHQGQFSTLTQQPKKDELIFKDATLTVYDAAYTNIFLKYLETTADFDGILQKMKSDRLSVVEIAARVQTN